MKVIVVEDNPVYNDYVCNLLKKGGFDTVQAYRLSAAKKLLAKAEEDDIVLIWRPFYFINPLSFALPDFSPCHHLTS